MNLPDDLRYTKTHEWARRLPAAPKSDSSGTAQAGEGEEIEVGITAHAQEELRDIVFIELPKIGKALRQGEPAAVIESVKAAFDIYAPVAGTITRVNEALLKGPQVVNQDCYGAGWLFALRPARPDDLAALFSAEAYQAQLKAETH